MGHIGSIRYVFTLKRTHFTVLMELVMCDEQKITHISLPSKRCGRRKREREKKRVNLSWLILAARYCVVCFFKRKHINFPVR